MAAGLVVGGVLSRVDCQRKERAGAISHDIKGDDGMDGEIRSGREGAAAQGVLRSREGSGKDRRAQLFNDYVQGSVLQVWRILLLLLLVTSAPACLQHSRNLGH